MQSDNVTWTIPIINNSYTLNYTLFWAWWWNLSLSRPAGGSSLCPADPHCIPYPSVHLEPSRLSEQLLWHHSACVPIPVILLSNSPDVQESHSGIQKPWSAFLSEELELPHWIRKEKPLVLRLLRSSGRTNVEIRGNAKRKRDGMGWDSNSGWSQIPGAQARATTAYDGQARKPIASWVFTPGQVS